MKLFDSYSLIVAVILLTLVGLISWGAYELFWRLAGMG